MYQIKCSLFRDKQDELNKNSLLEKIKMINPSLIILAGFLLKIPEQIIDYFPQKIVNIHPSLLPKYGGKGMYGMNVHKKIIENKESKVEFPFIM